MTSLRRIRLANGDAGANGTQLAAPDRSPAPCTGGMLAKTLGLKMVYACVCWNLEEVTEAAFVLGAQVAPPVL